MTISRSQASATASFTVPGQPPQPVELGYEVLVEGKSVIHRLARELPPAAVDLIEIAATVYAVDQMVARPRERQLDSGGSWARDVRLEVPVRLPDAWNARADGLAEMLAWLTDDSWELAFTQRAGGFGPLDTRQGFLFDTIPHGAVPVLFSPRPSSSRRRPRPPMARSHVLYRATLASQRAFPSARRAAPARPACSAASRSTPPGSRTLTRGLPTALAPWKARSGSRRCSGRPPGYVPASATRTRGKHWSCSTRSF